MSRLLSRIFPAVMYVVAVIALSVWLLHGWGFLWAGCVLLFWSCWFWFANENNSRVPAVVLYLCMVAWPVGMVFMGPPLISMADTDKTGRHHVANEIKQLTLAMLNYESAHGHLPPMCKVDAQGRPLHSWRILVLPFLGNEQGNEIYRQYRMDRPWDSPHNLAVAGQLQESLFGDEKDPTMATYKLVSGPGTPFDAGSECKLEGNSEKIGIVEDIKSPVLWTKPEDLSPEQVVAIFDAKNNPDGLYKQHGNEWSSTYTRKSWLGFLNGYVEKAYPLADSSQLLPFCLMDQNPVKSFGELPVGNVDLVERHGTDNILMAALVSLGLLGLMFYPAFGEHWSRFAGVFSAALMWAVVTSILAVLIVPICVSMFE